MKYLLKGTVRRFTTILSRLSSSINSNVSEINPTHDCIIVCQENTERRLRNTWPTVINKVYTPVTVFFYFIFFSSVSELAAEEARIYYNSIDYTTKLCMCQSKLQTRIVVDYTSLTLSLSLTHVQFPSVSQKCGPLASRQTQSLTMLNHKQAIKGGLMSTSWPRPCYAQASKQ